MLPPPDIAEKNCWPLALKYNGDTSSINCFEHISARGKVKPCKLDIRIICNGVKARAYKTYLTKYIRAEKVTSFKAPNFLMNQAPKKNKGSSQIA